MYKKACYLFSYGKLAYKGFVYTAVSLTWLCAIHKHSKNSTLNTKAFIKEQMHLSNKYLLHGCSPIQVGKVCKTSFAGHCKSLEIRLLDSELKGRKWGNMYSTGIFSNTPTIRGKLDWNWLMSRGRIAIWTSLISIHSDCVFTTLRLWKPSMDRTVSERFLPSQNVQ